MTDIRKHALQSTGIIHLTDGNDELMYQDDENGNPDLTKPMRIHAYGPGTKKYAAAKAAATNRSVDRLKKKGKSDLTAEAQVKETAEFLAACTESFENIEYGDLQGHALFMAVFSDTELCFIPAQFEKWIADTANFTKASPTT